MSFLPCDPETRLSLGRFLVHIHRLHVGVRRSLPAPAHHGLDAFRGTLEHRLHPSVGRVADPSRHAEGSSLFRTTHTEEDPLDTTPDDHFDAPHRHSVP